MENAPNTPTLRQILCFIIGYLAGTGDLVQFLT